MLLQWTSSFMCSVSNNSLTRQAGFLENAVFSTECYNVEKGLWTEKASVRTPRTKFAAVTTNDNSRILLMGGKKLLVFIHKAKF